MSMTKAEKEMLAGLRHQLQRETDAAKTLRDALGAAKSELHARLRAEQNRVTELQKLNETLREEMRALQNQIYTLAANKRDLETTRTELARAHRALVNSILKDC